MGAAIAPDEKEILREKAAQYWSWHRIGERMGIPLSRYIRLVEAGIWERSVDPK